MNVTWTSSPHRAVNTLRLGYTNQSVNVVRGNNRCSEIHTKHINTLCGQNVELLNVKPNHWAFTTLTVTQINFSLLKYLTISQQWLGKDEDGSGPCPIWGRILANRVLVTRNGDKQRTAERAAWSVAKQQRCRPLYSEQSHNIKTPCIVQIV